MTDAAAEVAELGRLLALAERKLGPQHPKAIDAREKLAYAYDRAERPEAAVPLLEQAVWGMDQVIGPMHKRTVNARKNLARLYYRCLRIADALPLYHYAAGQSAVVRGPLDSCTLQARSGVAKCLLQMRRHGEAIAEFERLLPDWAAGFGPAHLRLLWDRLDLAEAWEGTGDTQAALAQYWRLLSDCDRLLGPDAGLTRRLAGNLVPPPRPWRARQPLGTHRTWLVALSAILQARAHGTSLDTLYPRAALNRWSAREQLVPDWGIRSRDDLLEKLDWLAAGGHREVLAPRLGHPPAAWDFARYSQVVRNGYAAEYIDEPEAWQLLERIAGQLAGCYASWREFADDYLAGRLLWRTDTDDPGTYLSSQQQTIAAAARLLDPANAQSPWIRVPWDAITRPDQPLPVVTEPASGRAG